LGHPLHQLGAAPASLLIGQEPETKGIACLANERRSINRSSRGTVGLMRK